MKIVNHEIPDHVIESYLRACRYNETVGTTESDKMQVQCHYEILDIANIDVNSSEFPKFTAAITTFVNDILKKEYRV